MREGVRESVCVCKRDGVSHVLALFFGVLKPLNMITLFEE